jgi:beta-lactam-binding protein with PASTA domain
MITTSGLAAGAISTAASLTVPAGSVVSQSPIAGTSAVLGSSVTLVVSSGLPHVAVPSVMHATEAAATSAITAVGLVVGAVTTAPSDTIPAGSVIGQSPVGGADVVIGSSVALVISSGVPLVAVPNVTHLLQAATTTTLTSAGLTVGTVTPLASTVVPVGAVISQTPAAGTQVPVGTVVALSVSTGTPTLSIANATATEGNTLCAPCTSMTFTVTLSAASSQTVSVNYSTLQGTAVVTKDYVASSGTVTFAAGEMTKTIVIQIIGDTSRENTETMLVRIAGATNAVISDADGTGAIIDDDNR